MQDDYWKDEEEPNTILQSMSIRQRRIRRGISYVACRATSGRGGQGPHHRPGQEPGRVGGARGEEPRKCESRVAGCMYIVCTYTCIYVSRSVGIYMCSVVGGACIVAW